MLVVMQPNASAADIERVCDEIVRQGFKPLPMPGEVRTAIGLLGDDAKVDWSYIEGLPAVASVLIVQKPYRQAAREWKTENTIVEIAPGVRVGGDDIVIFAGPCSVESEEQIMESARAVRAAGATALRGGAFKPRSSPYAFQGMGKRGLELLALARQETGLAIVTEAMDEHGADLVAEYADCIQIGARNMQNYSLLRHVGKLNKPVLLKRGMAATINDLLLSAEYFLAEGNPNVILCERGVRTFDSATRNLFDLTAIPVVHSCRTCPSSPIQATAPVCVIVTPMARCRGCGRADGILVEVHPQPDKALSDGAQSLYPEQFMQLVKELHAIANAIGRTIAPTPAITPVVA
jgi:3-deoxy-7-phosphoheptulonate synthase